MNGGRSLEETDKLDTISYFRGEFRFPGVPLYIMLPGNTAELLSSLIATDRKLHRIA